MKNEGHSGLSLVAMREITGHHHAIQPTISPLLNTSEIF
jgi:hypothetical protein